ncbi:hypothetical protein SERLA73DRAFT_184766 [Serpula lacrymans var. lacrymans S7.3]|uniref:Glutathione S-transferase UstS-like C-terminal domain-containing protein n=2 Tax=Serpula lacrymans var. lacrymans TaxID=341189 RepID=F8Q532_SERL3|nr:uncharacterized protein SERLADRAFT_472866 [Serpula lacrymans var. lacrymans S7.9]EGN96659.1 hypothetical protein SERLA73DRAFT_184766 [Serpula lacrymans var. lacrymans S7.3]EGO22279.1 hypothetical protein SERLADRAFT_472866 [Serpula lacrymans var. lacrymans S7.9]
MLLQLAQSCGVLNPSSEKYFRETRESKFGIKIEEFSPVGAKRDADLAKGKEGLSTVHGWLSKNGGGKYILGSTVSYADGITGGWINWIRITQGPDSAVWKSLASHNGGFWGKYLSDLDTYASVQ